MNKRNQGFTLVEIMIVVAIIAILAAVAIPNFIKYRQNSQAAACVSNLKQIEAAVEQVKMTGKENPAYPTDLVGTDKYIKNEPKCPAGGTYELEKDGTPFCDKRKVDEADKSSWHLLIKE